MNYRLPYRLIALIALFGLLQGCAGVPAASEKPEFRHELSGAVTPWTHERFDAGSGKFTFAVFSDLTGGERERIFEVAVAQLSLLRPELILNIGDLIEGGTEDLAEIDRQWDSFDARTARTPAPVFYVGGNHDLTGAVLQDFWQQRYGPSYYHFIYKNTLFLVLDTEDHTPERMRWIKSARDHAIEVADKDGWDAFATTEYATMPENQAGNIGPQQSRYFQDVIAANPDVQWTFLFMHKAPWKREDMQAFADIEHALSERPYTVFNGHLHSYQHDVRHGRDYIRLATTGGVQLPNYGRSMDQVALITVSDSGVDIANVLLAGILDKTGHVPLGGDDLCFESVTCTEAE